VAESVVFARSARRELEQLDAGVARRIISRVEALGSNPRPRGCVKLQGTLPERRPTAAHSAASNTALERPHPQAGFCAVTYVLEDSQGAVRSRDSLGNDVIMGPGGIVWTQAGSGVIHHEFPADNDRELHGIQIFVNLSAKDKLAAPRVLRLAGNEVPRVAERRRRPCPHRGRLVRRRLVAAYSCRAVHLARRRPAARALLQSPACANGLVYVLEGGALVRSDDREEEVSGEHALALHGIGGHVRFEAIDARTSWFYLAPRSASRSSSTGRSS
jgi:redox-sensitive bicupin YhaK (pirin superfamily)